jgi:KDO2-lipid IV(A) lauroyltransferase
MVDGQDMGRLAVSTAAGVTVVRGLVTVFARCPAPLALAAGRRLGDLALLSLGSRRRATLNNIGLAFPELAPAARRRLARRAWQHLGMTLVELARLLDRPLGATLDELTIDGLEHIRGVMAEHGRALMLTAHLGNWEYLTAAHKLMGYPLAVVVRPLDSPVLDEMAATLRRKIGAELIDKRGALRAVLEALRRGRMVGVLLDQNATRKEGVFVPFFGRPASTSRSLALLALRTGTPIVPIFIRRVGIGRHRVVIEPPLAMPSSNDHDRAIVELTARCTETIEAAVRRTPEQWLWSHDRWRTRPPAPPPA